MMTSTAIKIIRTAAAKYLSDLQQRVENGPDGLGIYLQSEINLIKEALKCTKGSK